MNPRSPLSQVSERGSRRPNSPQHVAFCGGGSGGHLFPGLAVAEELLAEDAATQLTFLTSSRPVDERVLQNGRLPDNLMHHITLPLTSSRRRIRYVVNAGRSFLQCRSAFCRRRPDVVIGLGGFASIPGVLAAVWLRIPTVLLETNTVPGSANCFLSRYAVRAFSGWPIEDRFQHRLMCEIDNVGVPVRTEFTHLKRAATAQRTLLILGGSQGASRVNELAMEAVNACREFMNDWNIIHQTGPNDVQKVNSFYEGQSIDASVTEFLDNMPQALVGADVVISRSGAVTLAEIAAVRVPSILIPLSTSADDHQMSNAKLFDVAHASEIVHEERTDAGQQLTSAMKKLCSSSELRENTSAAAGSLGRNDAANRIVDALSQLLTPCDST